MSFRNGSKETHFLGLRGRKRTKIIQRIINLGLLRLSIEKEMEVYISKCIYYGTTVAIYLCGGHGGDRLL